MEVSASTNPDFMGQKMEVNGSSWDFQTWLAGKTPTNGSVYGKISYK
jgi:hypothetical protein